MALLLDEPASCEVDGLRRALGDTSWGTVPAHITLVPPVNVRHEELDLAVGTLRAAAAAQPGPLQVEIGPPATFWPVSPVVYLQVNGHNEVMAGLGQLHQGVLAGPLQRPERWPWVPHVTLADDAPPQQVAPMVGALASFRLAIEVDRVVLMEESGRQWAPLADACLGRPLVLNRGGLEVELIEGRLIAPDVWSLLAHDDVDDLPLDRAGLQSALSVVVTGRRSGAVAGVALAWCPRRPGAAVGIGVYVGKHWRGEGVGRALLAGLARAARRRDWDIDGAVPYGPRQFYERSSAWVRGPEI